MSFTETIPPLCSLKMKDNANASQELQIGHLFHFLNESNFEIPHLTCQKNEFFSAKDLSALRFQHEKLLRKAKWDESISGLQSEDFRKAIALPSYFCQELLSHLSLWPNHEPVLEAVFESIKSIKKNEERLHQMKRLTIECLELLKKDRTERNEEIISYISCLMIPEEFLFSTDLSDFLFTREGFLENLAFSHQLGNPLATKYLNQFLESFNPETSKKEQKVIIKVPNIHYRVEHPFISGHLHLLLFENDRAQECFLQASKRKDKFSKIAAYRAFLLDPSENKIEDPQSNPYFYLARAYFSPDSAKSKEFYLNAGKQNIAQGYFEAAKLSLEDKPNEAVEYLLKSAQLSKLSALSYLSELFLSQRKNGEAIRILQAMGECGDLMAYKSLGDLQKKQRKEKEAIEAYKRAKFFGIESLKAMHVEFDDQYDWPKLVNLIQKPFLSRH